MAAGGLNDLDPLAEIHEVRGSVKANAEASGGKGGGEPELAFIRAMVGVSVENFERTLEMIDAQYGSLPAYLEKALGFTAEEQQKMKEKYLK